MCGIAGAVSAHRGDVGTLVRRLTDALAHRGPDGCGFRYLRNPWAAVGHRRLSIVDLATGDQPIGNEDGRVWVVFNGELYNHLEIRHELETLGHRFRTHADTEVLVHGWEEWGRALLQRVNGIYAFALYDGRLPDVAGELWLARDPVGVKPLYLGISDGSWWFASELAAARQVGLLGGGDLRAEAIDEFLVYRFVPSPGTPYRNAWKVPPGHLCRLSFESLPAQPAFEPFTTQFERGQTPTAAAEWEEALQVGLAKAVKRQLMSDVPVGSLLSGGVDSTLITGFMRKELAEPPQAFAVGFKDPGAPDELREARRAAEALQVPLAEVPVWEEEYLASWPKEVAKLAEPIANSSVWLVGLLCRTVGMSRKVVLCGQGADEPLGGYPRHVAERYYRLARLTLPILNRLPEGVATADRLARMRRIASHADESCRFAETLAVFGPGEAVALTGHSLDPDSLVAPVRRWMPQEEGPDSVNRLLRVDARLSLADDLLVVADHMAMASSVELRVPFLDLEFFGLLERMPSRFKISDLGERKWLYRRAARPLLPRTLRSDLTGWRARTERKLGFSTPLDRWLRRWTTSDGERFLLGPRARLPDFLRAEGVRSLITAVRDRHAPRARQLLALYVLEVWLRGALGA